MSNCYTQGSVALCLKPGGYEAFAAYLEEHWDEDENFNLYQERGVTHVYDDEAFHIDAFIDTLAHALEATDDDQIVEFSVAYTCDRAEPDAYGGDTFRVGREGQLSDAPGMRKFLDLSTFHVPSEKDADWLYHEVCLFTDAEGRDAMLYICSDEDQVPADWPDWLKAIDRHARRRGADYVMFSPDAGTVDGLETWDW